MILQRISKDFSKLSYMYDLNICICIHLQNISPWWKHLLIIKIWVNVGTFLKFKTSFSDPVPTSSHLGHILDDADMG